MRGEIFRICPDRPWGPRSLLYNGYRFFLRGEERPGRDADPSPLLVPWQRKSRAIPLLPLWAVRPVQRFSVCTRVQFTFFIQNVQPYTLYKILRCLVCIVVSCLVCIFVSCLVCIVVRFLCVLLLVSCVYC